MWKKGRVLRLQEGSGKLGDESGWEIRRACSYFSTRSQFIRLSIEARASLFHYSKMCTRIREENESNLSSCRRQHASTRVNSLRREEALSLHDGKPLIKDRHLITQDMKAARDNESICDTAFWKHRFAKRVNNDRFYEFDKINRLCASRFVS